MKNNNTAPSSSPIVTPAPWRPMRHTQAMVELCSRFEDDKRDITQYASDICSTGYSMQLLLAKTPANIEGLLNGMLLAPSVENFVAVYVAPWANNPALKQLAETTTTMANIVKNPTMQDVAKQYIDMQLAALPKSPITTDKPSMRR